MSAEDLIKDNLQNNKQQPFQATPYTQNKKISKAAEDYIQSLLTQIENADSNT